MQFRWLALGIVLLFACRGSASAQQQAPAASSSASSPPFAFTNVDLELLQQTKDLDQQMEEHGGLYNDAPLTEYVSAVGNDVLPQGLPDPLNVKWQFHVLRDPVPNAFALANGSIYVNTGLLALLENEAQLASVLAHEETHVLNRHSYLENRKSRKKALVGNILSGVVGNELPAAILEGTIYGYDRELEKEADLRAVTATNDANYSTEEMIAALKLLDSSHEVDLSQNFYQDHPRLKDRIAYVSDAIEDTHARTPHPMVEEERYFAATEKAARDNIPMDINEGRQRTAVATAQRLVKKDAKSAENFRVLGDALRALGPRAPDPTPEELSSRGKKDERKALWKMTPQEYEGSLMASPAGKAAWDVNRKQSEEAYRKALEIDPSLAAAHRGLGFLYEKEQLPAQSAAEFQKYLELAPNAMDQAQIRRRLEIARKQSAANAPAPAAP
jgi:predicted Zn-dependent protease